MTKRSIAGRWIWLAPRLCPVCAPFTPSAAS